MNKVDERRKEPRFDAEVDLNFSYEMETKVKFKVDEKKKKKASSKQYGAITRNISTEGLCFKTHKQLKAGDAIHVRLFLPHVREFVDMDGEVRWATQSKADKPDHPMYDVGIHLDKVEGQPVHESTYFDKEYQVGWSVLLESVLGSYRKYIFKETQARPK